MISITKIISKIIFVQVAKKTAQKSKTLLTDIERWQKVIAPHAFFFITSDGWYVY